MPSPFTEALQKLAQRGVVPADLSSSQWADVPAALRERAFFSARVQNAAYLQEIKSRVESILNPRTETREDGSPVTRGINPATARAELKQLLQGMNYDPGEKAGGIEDLGSDRRLELQLKQNVESAQGFGNFLQGQAEGAIDAFPAQELFRAEDRKEPRAWPTRWMQAGGQIFGGRMIALKNDPIWERISAFDTPWPPFDFNSGMWVRDVARAEAVELGLLEENETVAPAVEDFNARLESSAEGLDGDLLASLQQSFGDKIAIDGGKVRWVA